MQSTSAGFIGNGSFYRTDEMKFQPDQLRLKRFRAHLHLHTTLHDTWGFIPCNILLNARTKVPPAAFIISWLFSIANLSEID